MRQRPCCTALCVWADNACVRSATVPHCVRDPDLALETVDLSLLTVTQGHPNTLAAVSVCWSHLCCRPLDISATRPPFSQTNLVSSLRRQLCHIFKVKRWASWWQVRRVDLWPSCLSVMFSQRPPPGVVRRFFSSSPGGWERLGEGNVSETVWEPHSSLVVSVSRAVASTLNQYGFC